MSDATDSNNEDVITPQNNQQKITNKFFDYVPSLERPSNRLLFSRDITESKHSRQISTFPIATTERRSSRKSSHSSDITISPKSSKSAKHRSSKAQSRNPRNSIDLSYKEDTSRERINTREKNSGSRSKKVPSPRHHSHKKSRHSHDVIEHSSKTSKCPPNNLGGSSGRYSYDDSIKSCQKFSINEKILKSSSDENLKISGAIDNFFLDKTYKHFSEILAMNIYYRYPDKIFDMYNITIDKFSNLASCMGIEKELLHSYDLVVIEQYTGITVGFDVSFDECIFVADDDMEFSDKINIKNYIVYSKYWDPKGTISFKDISEKTAYYPIYVKCIGFIEPVKEFIKKYPKIFTYAKNFVKKQENNKII
jgi:hypothetical protein